MGKDAAVQRASVTGPVIQPADVMAGLGAADRPLLATCIALFEDSGLTRRVGALFEKARTEIDRKLRTRHEDPPAAVTNAQLARSVRTQADQWRDSSFSDAQLRVALWIYLRNAFDLPARTCASTRSAATACDDLTAHLLHAVGPSWWARIKQSVAGKGPPESVNLDSLARQTLEEMLKQVLDGNAASGTDVREELLARTRERVQRLDNTDRTALMQSIQADELNDVAIRNILLTGGALTVFSSSVGMAGFSAYILAAQASAFIPLVSGPALVSLVAVLSNPITVIAVTTGGGWWMSKTVQQRVQVAVATRVIALLAMNGLLAGSAGLRDAATAFRKIPDLRPFGDLNQEAITRYQKDWQLLEPAWRRDTWEAPASAVMLEQPAPNTADRLERVLGVTRSDLEDTALLSVLTLGDIVYQAFAIDPTVMTAADFSHVADLGSVVDFAAFASKIEAMDPAAKLGAVSDLKGYVAERVVAAQLINQGHQVSFPDASNQPGWDISVDGVPVQIKDTDSIEYLGQHFAHWGEKYPVIVNSEMAQRLSDHHEIWADHVYYVEGYNNEVVEHVTSASVDAGTRMDHPHVPMFTLAISAVRNYRRFAHDEVTGAQAVQQVLLDGGTKMTLAAAGGLVGPAVGLLVFGPAGALVLGAIVPLASQLQAGRVQGLLNKHLSSASYRKWGESTLEAMDFLVDDLRKALKVKAGLLQSRIDAVPADSVGDYLRWRLRDELAGLCESGCRLDTIVPDSSSNIELTVARLLRWLSESTVHPVTYQDKIKELEKVLKTRPSVPDRMSDQTLAVAERGKAVIGFLKGKLRKP